MLLHKPNIKYETNLEGLRGLCALIVAISHIFSFNFFSSGTVPLYQVIMHLDISHQAVLIFFTISGFVIGINYNNTAPNGISIKKYIKSRFLRIYPIYLLAILLTFSLLWPAVQGKQVLAHLLFLQEFVVKTASSNGPLWSLSYEVVYYILFIGLWLLRLKPLHYLLLTLFILVYAIPGTDIFFLKPLLIGWLFWISGYFVAAFCNIEHNTAKKLPIFISCLFLLLSYHFLEIPGMFARLLGVTINFDYRINFGDLLFLPLCFLIIATVTQRSFRFKNQLLLISYLLPLLHIAALLYYKHDLFSRSSWQFGFVYLLISISILFIKFDVNLLKKLVPVGKSSYSLYIFHFPIAMLLDHYLSQFLNGIQFFVIGVSLWLGLTILSCVVTEKIMQPKIKKYFA